MHTDGAGRRRGRGGDRKNPEKSFCCEPKWMPCPCRTKADCPLPAPMGRPDTPAGTICTARRFYRAAKMLKENEASLRGTVRLLFQPGEETFEGAAAMIEAGLLRSPRPDIAYTGHVTTRYRSVRSPCARARRWRPAIPSVSLSPERPRTAPARRRGSTRSISGRTSILPCRSCLPVKLHFDDKVTLNFGMFRAGNVPNTIPEQAELQGTLRTFDNELRKRLIRRIGEIARSTAADLLRHCGAVCQCGRTRGIQRSGAVCRCQAVYRRKHKSGHG